jgi:hypothetical protein
MLGTYKLTQKMPGGEKMVGFTRILHRMTHDALSPKIDTFLAKPLHPGAPAGTRWMVMPLRLLTYLKDESVLAAS